MSEAEEPGFEAALELLAARTAELEGRLGGVDESEAALRRAPLETLAMLAWALPAEAAPAGMRDRLLARLQGDETQLVAPMHRLGPPPETPALRLPPSPASGPFAAPAVPPRAPGAGARPAAPAVRRPPELAPPVARRAWALPLAAVLALATLALAGWSFLLQRDLAQTREELAKARRHATELVAQLDAAQQEGTQAAALHSRMQQMQGQLALVTASGTLVCPLKPSPGAPAADAKGVLFVGADHQHWYLRAQKLAALPPDRQYQLWFLVGDQPVAAGAFELSGEEGVLASPTMPHGTSAAMVTVEPAGAPGARPSGPVVLYGRSLSPLV